MSSHRCPADRTWSGRWQRRRSSASRRCGRGCSTATSGGRTCCSSAVACTASWTGTQRRATHRRSSTCCTSPRSRASRHVRAASRPGADAWGQAFTGHLLPWCAAGGDAYLHRYAAQTGADASPDTLWAASVAYWLAHVSYQVSRYAQRSQDPTWLRKNLDVVADELARVGRGGPTRA